MRQDFLKECMSDPALVKAQVPIDEFNRVYCIRCFQKECGRAGGNGTTFTRRVENWKTDLFEKPPRAAPEDPQYASIRAKRFLQIANQVTNLRQNGVNYEVQTREMPSFVDALKKPEAVPAPPDTELELADPPVDPSPALITFQPTAQPVLEPPQVQPAAAAAAPAPPPPAGGYQNTPFEQGEVLPGGAKEEKTVEVGGSYVFGSDDS